MNLFIANEYSLLKKIGTGAFSSVYHGKKIDNSHDVAIKLEPSNAKHPQLEYEAKILRLLQGEKGITRLHWFGQEGDFNIMIMDLLGPSLNDLFEYSGKKFSLKTVLMLAEQMISLIELLHENNFIHRDIKPDNFLIGREKQSDQIFLIDFGLSTKFRDPRTGLHIPFQDNRSLAGVARYVSINTHLGIEQSRRDDLESLGYCLLYFLRGDLPWMGVQAPDNRKKYDKIREIKVATPIEVLCQDFPSEFEVYMNYCRSLKFEERPDYVWLKRNFKDLFNKLEYQWNLSFDWAELSVSQEKEEQKKKVILKEEINDTTWNVIKGTLEMNIKGAYNLPNMDMVGASDPYCIYTVFDKRVEKKKESLQDQKTRMSNIVDDNNNPIWNFTQSLPLSLKPEDYEFFFLSVKVFDKDMTSDEFIGKFEMGLAKIFQKSNKLHKSINDLFNKKGEAIGKAQIEIELKFVTN